MALSRVLLWDIDETKPTCPTFINYDIKESKSNTNTVHTYDTSTAADHHQDFVWSWRHLGTKFQNDISSDPFTGNCEKRFKFDRFFEAKK